MKLIGIPRACISEIQGEVMKIVSFRVLDGAKKASIWKSPPGRRFPGFIRSVIVVVYEEMRVGYIDRTCLLTGVVSLRGFGMREE